jgi:hypothetical protein
MGHELPLGGADKYVYDSQDMGNDLIVQVTVLAGSVALTGGLSYGAVPVGSFPLCSLTSPQTTPAGASPTPAGVLRPRAVWQAAGDSSTPAIIRIAAKGPCNPSLSKDLAGAPAARNCTWAPGALNLVVTATSSAPEYYICVTSFSDPLRAQSGYPTAFSQTLNALPPTVVAFSTIPLATLSEVKLIFVVDIAGVPTPSPPAWTLPAAQSWSGPRLAAPWLLQGAWPWATCPQGSSCLFW